MVTNTDIFDDKINDLSSYEKMELIKELLEAATAAHLEIEHGSDQVTALGRLAQAKRVMQRLEDDFINMAI